MTRRACDGAGLLGALRAAVANLEIHASEIDALNVYPVPDGDTGANMLATARAALEEAERAESVQADRIAAAVSFGALMGARGNSGVILSQVLRGMADAMQAKRHFNGLDIAHALTVGSQTAYGAVARPVEGTILTVVREAAAAAVEAAERENDIEVVLAAAVEAADRAVDRTPTQLAVLREAGVVDAGGAGFYRVLQGAYRHIVGEAPTLVTDARVGGARPSAIVPHADEGYGYETMFLVEAKGSTLDLDAIRTHLETIGESVLVAGDARAAKIHVHSERPDEVIAYGLGQGTLSRISVENLDRQAREAQTAREAHTARVEAHLGSGTIGETAVVGDRVESRPIAVGVAAATVPPVRAVAGVRQSSTEPPVGTGRNGHWPVPAEGLGVVAVASGDGLAAVFESFGVSAVVGGGQSDNPSTGELLAAIEHLESRDVLLLPNNPNVVMAARQVASLADRPVHVVPSRNAAEGIAALLALDPTLDAAANVGPMTAAARAIQTLQVTRAIRDAKVGGQKIKKGQTIVLDPDDGLVAADGDGERAILRGLDALREGYELVTVYYGEGVDLAEAEAVAQWIGQRRPEIEVEVVRGGQPHYQYLIAAE